MLTVLSTKNPHAFSRQIVNKHVDNVDNLLLYEIFADIYHISGAHSYQQISGITIFFQKCFDFSEGREIETFCSAGQDRVPEIL